MSEPLTFGSLFAGIGGFDLGFERAGMQCKWAVEINKDARSVYGSQFKTAEFYDDIRTFLTGYWQRSRFAVDVIAGGFPCIDISSNGKRAGIKGKHSSLWWEMLRVVRLLRPRFVVVENVPDILARGRGMSEVLGGLAESGFDAEWDVLPACAFGSPQRRERVFIVAYPCGLGLEVKRELRILRQVGSFADSLLQGERRAAHAARVVRGVGSGIPAWLDTSGLWQEAIEAHGKRSSAASGRVCGEDDRRDE